MKLSTNQRSAVISAVLFLFVLPTLYAQFFFNGSAGVEGSIFLDTEPVQAGAVEDGAEPTKKIGVGAQAFFTGQFQFGDKLLLNAGFSVDAPDFGNTLLTQLPPSIRPFNAFFSLDELSFAYRYGIDNNLGQVSLFLGEYESFGTDVFLRRYLGTKEVSPDILTKEFAVDKISIIPIDGFGLSLNTKYQAPIATAFYLSYTQEDYYVDRTNAETLKTKHYDPFALNEAGDGFLINHFYEDIAPGSAIIDIANPWAKRTERSINANFRLAAVTDVFIGDFIAGAEIELVTADDANKENYDKYLATIQEAPGSNVDYSDSFTWADPNAVLDIRFALPAAVQMGKTSFHAGTTMIIGNPMVNFYLQAGITGVQFLDERAKAKNDALLDTDPTKIDVPLSLSNLYVFMEQRFGATIKYAVSLFMLPEDRLPFVEYIDLPVGLGFSMESQPIAIGNAQGVIGGYVSASLANPLTTDDFTLNIGTETNDSTSKETNVSAVIAPYIEMYVQNAIAGASLEIRPLEFADIDEMFKLSISYKMQF